MGGNQGTLRCVVEHPNLGVVESLQQKWFSTQIFEIFSFYELEKIMNFPSIKGFFFFFCI